MTLSEWQRNKLREYRINCLYHLTHVGNLPGIFARGLLPRNVLGVDGYRDISLETAQERRHDKFVTVAPGKHICVHDMVPLFVVPVTPMLYKVRDQADALCFILVQSFYLARPDVDFAFTDGNIASDRSRAYYSCSKLEELPWDVLDAEYWTDFEDGSRRRGAEFLIHPGVPVAEFWKICVRSDDKRVEVQRLATERGLDLTVEVTPRFFAA